MAILVDGASKKTLMSQWLEKGEDFEQHVDLGDADVQKKMTTVGIRVDKLNPQLYFIPSKYYSALQEK